MSCIWLNIISLSVCTRAYMCAHTHTPHTHTHKRLEPRDMGLNCVVLCPWKRALAKTFIQDPVTQWGVAFLGVYTRSVLFDLVTLLFWKTLVFSKTEEKCSLLFRTEIVVRRLIYELLQNTTRNNNPGRTGQLWATCWQFSGQIWKVCSSEPWDWQWIKPHPLQKILNLGMEEISFPHPVFRISELSTQMTVVKFLVLEDVLFLFLSVHHGVGGGASAF